MSTSYLLFLGLRLKRASSVLEMLERVSISGVLGAKKQSHFLILDLIERITMVDLHVVVSVIGRRHENINGERKHMSELIQLVDFSVDIQKPYPINARDLWAGLEIGKEFSNWIKEQITRASVNHGKDYVFLSAEKGVNSGRGRARKEYWLTVRAAKEITIISNTEKGKEYRKALIQLEEKYFAGELTTPTLDKMTEAKKSVETMLGIYSLFNIPTHIAQVESVKQTKKLTGVDLSEILKLAPAQDNIAQEDVMLEPTECAKHFGIKSAIAFNRKLESLGLQEKINGAWAPTYKSQGMYSKHAWSSGSKSGYNFKWNVSKLREVLSG